jgi:hypothetical protein
MQLSALLGVRQTIPTAEHVPINSTYQVGLIAAAASGWGSGG